MTPLRLTKKVLSLICLCAYLVMLPQAPAVATGATAQASTTAPIPGSDRVPETFDSGIDPIWQIEKITFDPKVKIGETFDITVDFRNIGSGPGIQPVIRFSQDALDELQDFEVQASADKSVYDPMVLRIESGQRVSYTVTLRVLQSARELPEDNPGYKIKVEVLSTNEALYSTNEAREVKNEPRLAEKRYRTAKDIYIKPVFTLSQPLLTLQKVEFTTPVDVHSKDVEAILTLVNQSDAKAKNVSFNLIGKAEGDKGENITVTDLTSTKHFPEIAGRQTIQLHYKMKLNDKRTNNAMTLTTNYEGLGAPLTEQVNLPLPLKDNVGDDVGKTPRVIIKKYSVSPEQVLAGGQVVVTLELENTNAKAIKNLQLSLKVPQNEGTSGSGQTTGGTVFSPVNSSNTFYIEGIPAKTVMTKTITMAVDPNAVAKTYIVPVEIAYEDMEGTAIQASDNLNIPVGQKSSIDFISKSIPEMGNVGMPFDYNIEFVNSGKVALSNFKVTMEGDVPGAQNHVYYIGKFDVGATDSFAGTIVPSEEGLLNGLIVLTYQDNFGKEIRTAEPFIVDVGPEIPMEMPMEMPMEEPSFFATWQGKATIALGIVLLLGIAAFIWRRRKARQREKELNYE